MRIKPSRAAVLAAGLLAVTVLACGTDESAPQTTEAEPAPAAAAQESAAPAAAPPPASKSVRFDGSLMCQLLTADDVARELRREFHPGRSSYRPMNSCRFAPSGEGDRNGVYLAGSGYPQAREDFGRTGELYERRRAQAESCRDGFADVSALSVRAFRTWGRCGEGGSRLTFEAGPQVVLDLGVDGDPEASPDALASLARRALDRAKAL
ncbi:MAG TPA: hypothetical protein VKM72_00910 [Thermoanaerobaculia bacterium]|nr:hypothetical protein [Thermoanaerobaculia bacterium]